MKRRSKYKRGCKERTTQYQQLDLGRRRKELQSPAPAHHLRDDDEDETGCNDSSLYTKSNGSTRLGNPLGLEISDAETTYTMSAWQFARK
jgi:hypothetical protein